MGGITSINPTNIGIKEKLTTNKFSEETTTISADDMKASDRNAELTDHQSNDELECQLDNNSLQHQRYGCEGNRS